MPKALKSRDAIGQTEAMSRVKAAMKKHLCELQASAAIDSLE
jgi:hypothetical protein